MQNLSEEELTKDFLLPLYQSEGMDCHNVKYVHKSLEFGKDIIYYKDDEHGNRAYIAIQVKKTKITTSKNDNIIRQITEAFGKKFTDDDGKERDIDRFVVLTSNEFGDDAKDSLFASLRTYRLDKLVTLVDGNRVVELLDEHLKSAFWDYHDIFNKYFIEMKNDFETIKDISAIGNINPIPLEEIYVSMKMQESKSLEQGKSLEEDPNIKSESLRFVEDSERSMKGKIFDVEEVVENFNQVVIVGVPGSGKTTLLRHLAIKQCIENLEKQDVLRVPILITLRELLKSKNTLREYIDVVFEKYKFLNAKEFIEKDLKKGKCMVLLDGFDELVISKNQELITECIHNFVKEYPENQVIVTSRVSGYNDELKNFNKFELMEFDEDQIKKFINNWFVKNDPKKAESMINSIMENKRLKKLVHNPLMIAIVAVIYEEGKKLPEERVKLYKSCIEILLSKWDLRRVENKYSSDQKMFILRKLAIYAHSSIDQKMNEKEILKEISKYLPQVQLKKEDAKPLLEEIWKRNYVLRQISMEEYDFLHLSFQEYLTALELNKKGSDGLSTIIEHLHDSWWEEPILLYAGITEDAKILINRIKEEVEEDIFHSNLFLMGKCVFNAKFTDMEVKKEVINDLWNLYHETPHSSLQSRAVHLLFLINSEETLQVLLNELNSKNIKIRERAIKNLGTIDNKKSLQSLIEALETDKYVNIRSKAATSLGEIRDETSADSLISILQNEENIVVKANIIIALGFIGSKDAIDPLISVINTNPSNLIVLSLSIALKFLNCEKIDELVFELFENNEDKTTKSIALEILGFLQSKNALKPLIGILTSDKDEDIKIMAIKTLGEIGDKSAIPSLIDISDNSKDEKIKEHALYALGDLGNEKLCNR